MFDNLVFKSFCYTCQFGAFLWYHYFVNKLYCEVLITILWKNKDHFSLFCLEDSVTDVVFGSFRSSTTTNILLKLKCSHSHKALVVLLISHTRVNLYKHYV